MLALTIKPDWTVCIGDDIQIHNGGDRNIKIGVECPREIVVHRMPTPPEKLRGKFAKQ